MLEFDDIQHMVLTRVPAITGRYEFLSFRQPAQGRSWLSGILDKVASGAEVAASVETDKRWVSVAFTWPGLRQFEALASDGRRTLSDIDRTFRNFERNPRQFIFGGNSVPEYRR